MEGRLQGGPTRDGGREGWQRPSQSLMWES